MRALLALLLLCGVARAESPNELEAKRRFGEGQKLFDKARYAEALVEFQRSHELSGYPAILHKIALCHDQLGHAADAIAAYRKYLEADPQSERRAGTEERIKALEASLRPAPPAPLLPPVAPAAPAAPAPPPPEHTPVYKKWWLWTVVGVVVAGGAVGLGVGLTVKTSPTPADFDATLGRFGPGY
jgi:tetratricopeptide (TPR) repeat protein